MSKEKLLSVKNLKTHFTVGNSIVKAVDGISFDLEPGKTFAIVGESGSGKSITALSIMGLLPNNLASTDRGEITFNNSNLINMEEKEMRKIRARIMWSISDVNDLVSDIEEFLKSHKDEVDILTLIELYKPVKGIKKG